MPETSSLSWEDAVRWARTDPNLSGLVHDCFYDDPIGAAAQRYYASSEWLAVRKELPSPPGVALDIGAGRGISSFALASDGWRVTALEPDSSDLVGSGAIRALCAENRVEIDIVNQWGESLPFGDAEFDLVYCRASLHHARNLKTLCSEIARVLKRGGRLIATREHVISRKGDLKPFLDAHPLHYLYGGENAYLLSDYRRAIEQSGLKLNKTLNPLASDINTFPSTREQVKSRISAKLKVWPAWLIPNCALNIHGWLNQAPGRLFSFIATRPR